MIHGNSTSIEDYDKYIEEAYFYYVTKYGLNPNTVESNLWDENQEYRKTDPGIFNFFI